MDFTTDERADPANCQTMAQVRQGVDAIDRLLVAVIAERQRYMDAAARIKSDAPMLPSPDSPAVRESTRPQHSARAPTAETVWRAAPFRVYLPTAFAAVWRAQIAVGGSAKERCDVRLI